MWFIPYLLTLGSVLTADELPGGGGSRPQTPASVFSLLKSLPLAQILRMPKIHEDRKLGVAGQGHKTPEGRPAFPLGSINNNRDDHSSSASSFSWLVLQAYLYLGHCGLFLFDKNT